MTNFMASFAFVGVVALWLWNLSLSSRITGAQQVIGHMLLGNITGAKIDEDGEVEIEYKDGVE